MKNASDNPSMRTVSLSLNLDDAQFDLLSRACGSYNAMWSDVLTWAKENRTANRTRMQKALYRDMRSAYPELPSQFVCIAIRDVAGALKSWNSNNPDKRWELEASRRATTVSYDLRVMSLRGRLLSLGSLTGEKRIRVLLADEPAFFTERYPAKALKAAKVILDPKRKAAKANLVYQIPEANPKKGGKTVGVDLGIHSLYTTDAGEKHDTSRMNEVRRRHAHNRKTLKEKGTRSARRRRASLKGREKRFIRDANHCAAKQLIESCESQGASVIAMEDLTHIRKSASKKSRRSKTVRNMLNGWPFAQFQEFVEYKAAAKGISVVYVSPAYTSQRCCLCGYTDADNRDRARFDCFACGHSCDADINAACNIRDKATSKHTHGSARGQALSQCAAWTDGSL